MRSMMKMAADKNVLLLTSCGLFRPGGKTRLNLWNLTNTEEDKVFVLLQCSLNNIGAYIFILAIIKSGCATEKIPFGSLKALKSKWH